MSRRPQQTDDAAELESTASTVQRLAVLLAAGVAPASAWGYLAEPESAESRLPETASTLNRVAVSISSGGPIAEAILLVVEGRTGVGATSWRGLAAAWFVATEAGAPLASTLNDLAATIRDLAQTGREVQVALAAPVATARMVLALPAVGVLFGMVLGYDTIGTLFTTPIGIACLGSGGLLMLAARAWNRRLVKASSSARETPGLALDLIAIAVSGGSSIERARAAVVAACQRAGLSLAADSRAADNVLELSQRAGIPAARLLRAQAEEARRHARSEGARNAATLAVKLMLPLGLCILPAFMLLGVAPLLIAVISSTVATF